jgi:hypothetical protein
MKGHYTLLGWTSLVSYMGTWWVVAVDGWVEIIQSVAALANKQWLPISDRCA